MGAYVQSTGKIDVDLEGQPGRFRLIIYTERCVPFPHEDFALPLRHRVSKRLGIRIKNIAAPMETTADRNVWYIITLPEGMPYGQANYLERVMVPGILSEKKTFAPQPAMAFAARRQGDSKKPGVVKHPRILRSGVAA